MAEGRGREGGREALLEGRCKDGGERCVLQEGADAREIAKWFLEVLDGEGR